MNKDIINQLKKRKVFSLLADGESMLPLLHPKDLVNYQKISFSKIKVNDLILVFKNNLAFTHRVIYKNKSFLIVKGDNNLKSDGKIYPRHIIGKVTSVKRKNKIVNPEMVYLIQSSLYFKELTKITNLLNKEKIDHVFLKGLPVHLYYEKTYPRRFYQDADILISKKSYKKFDKLLDKLGYVVVDHSLSEVHKKLRDKDSEITYYKLINGFPIVIDIHFEAIFLMNQLGNLEVLYPQKYIDKMTNEMLENKKQITVGGQKFFILNTKYLILFLAFHLFRHNFTGAFRLELLDKIIRKKQLTAKHWQSINQIIRRYQLTNFVSPVFYLLKKYYKTPAMKQWNNLTIKQYRKINIFDGEDRLSMGINRFFILFLLSPRPFYKKILIFTYPKIIYAVIFSLLQKFKNLLK